MEVFHSIFLTALTLTGIVLVMMLMIEFINVKSNGKWLEKMQKNVHGQIILGTLMGLLPGCFGTFFMVSLFTHGNVGFGALVATLIATSGDEAFLMFSMFPVKAIIIHIFLAVIAIIAGYATHYIFKNKKINLANMHFEVHEHDTKKEKTSIIENLKHITFQRALLLFGLALVIINLTIGGGLHSHENEHALKHFHFEEYIQYVFAALALITFFAILKLPEHFISEHLWGHVIKKHFLKIFLWTFGALLVIELALPVLDLEVWVKENPIILLLIACLIGIIPESGPHMVFVTMFASGVIPLGVLMGSSIVQDGHGALPLLAESRKGFLLAKFISVIIGFLVGYAFILLNINL
ncbi:MAG: arsenic efflux protein [Bacteroidales bacterium]|nr:arsenic efflux protein [Bacteroidales bacterium]